VSPEKAFAARLGDRVRPVFGNGAFATQRRKETLVLACFFEERKNVKRVLTENLVARDTGDALHRVIPDDIAASAIKRENSVDAGVEQASE